MIAPASPAISRRAGRTTASKAAVTAATANSHHQCAISSPARIHDETSSSRARELEAVGFLQLTLAAREKISWAGGFTVAN